MRYAIIVCGGISSRYGKDKLNETLLGKPLLEHSVNALLTVADKTVVVGRRVEGAEYVPAGETRFFSVLNGLKALPDEGTVAVHDGARPFVTRAFAQMLFREAERYGSAVPRLPVSDTLYCDKDVCRIVDRESYFTVQTPQAFDLRLLKQAYEKAAANPVYTDDSSVFAAANNALHFVDGLTENVKITYRGDLPEFRAGNGFDVHSFTEGDGVTLGGVKIPFDKKLLGHSDADVLCHAVCDAILSASGNKDIGHQFPDSDPAYKGADSTLLLARCVELAAESGFETVNVAATVICQAPKISPYADRMARRIAEICGITPSCVSISATTTEHLGALGNGDGIAAEATALLRLNKRLLN